MKLYIVLKNTNHGDTADTAKKFIELGLSLRAIARQSSLFGVYPRQIAALSLAMTYATMFKVGVKR